MKKVKAPGAELGQAQPSIAGDKSTKEPDEFEVKGHLEDILRAHEIINNPEKMRHVHKLAGRRTKAMKSIKDIESYHQEKYGKPPMARLKDEAGSED